MEQLNRIEIRGNIGNVNILKVRDTRVAHFSVATNFAYKDRNGEPVIETTWHNVTAWEGNKGITSLDVLQKGFPIYVQRRNGEDGSGCNCDEYRSRQQRRNAADELIILLLDLLL